MKTSHVKKKTKQKSRLYPLIASCLFVSGAHAANFTTLVGSGDDADTVSAQISVGEPLLERPLTDAWRASVQLQASVTNINGRGTGAKNATTVGLTPVLQVTSPTNPIYAEFGIGFNYFDQKRINDSKVMGTHFQFGDLIGFGLRTADGQLQVGYRFIHYSNAGISSSNPGLDLHMLAVRASF